MRMPVSKRSLDCKVAFSHCLGRTLLHVMLDIAHSATWVHYGWRHLFLATLNSSPLLVDSKDAFGRTALYIASEKGNDEVVAQLLKRNANLRTRTGLGVEPLHIAAASEHVSTCRLLLQAEHCDVNATDSVQGWTPLFYAVSHSNSLLIQLLLNQANVDVDHRDSKSLTPFHLAVQERKLGLMKFLGAHPAVDVNNRDNLGNSVLHCGTTSFLFIEGFKYLLHELSIFPNFRNSNHDTPLMLAVRKHHHEIVKLLAQDERVWLSARNSGGDTALTVALEWKTQQALLDAFVKRWGPDWNILVDKASKWVPIHVFGAAEVGIQISRQQWMDLEHLIWYFESNDICGWANVSPEHWRAAEIVGAPLMAHLMEGPWW
jgi:ankyrin repeat protein